MDKELTTIREFISFANEILGKSKSVNNLFRLVANPKTLLPSQVVEIKQIFSTYFCNIVEWKNFSGQLAYKTGVLSMSQLEKACSKKEDDLAVFNEYMNTFRSIYFDIKKNLSDFVVKLGLDENSPESLFMTGLINEIGGDLIDTIKSGGEVKDIAVLLPRLFEIVKSGKLTNLLNPLKDGKIKFSKVLRAVTNIVEEWEKEQNVQLEAEAVPTDVNIE